MPTTNEQTVAAYFAATRSMDIEGFVNAFTPDAVSHDPVGTPAHHGHEALRSFLGGVFSLLDTFGLTENSVFLAGNSAAIKWTGTGVGKNGKSVSFEGIDVMDFNAEGKIVMVHAYWDPAPVLAILQS
jgi:steroid delta-isomerase